MNVKGSAEFIPYNDTQNVNQSVTENPSTENPGCFKNAKIYFSEFCSNTSIHGFTFLGERKRTLMEKIWWLIVIILSLCGCTKLISKTYQKWVSSPVIVSFATSQTSIGEIPFPAITLCSDIVARRDRFNFTDVYQRMVTEENVTSEEANRYNYLNMICETGAGLNYSTTKITNSSALDFITYVAPEINRAVKSIKWRGTTYNHPEQFLTPILNSEGVCYTFNILDRKDLFTDQTIHYQNFFMNGNSSSWTIENGFTNNHSKYPRSSVTSGMDGGIDFVFYAFDDDIDYRCSQDFVGFKVTLQHPALIPKGRKNFISIPLDQIVLASVKPIMMKTSNELRSYTPQKRQCYFISEKNLRFYKNYNQPNCLMECLTNATLESCGCVAFYMPRDKSTPICGSGNRKCMERAKALYLTPDFKTKTNPEGNSKSYKDQCDCLPSCTSLDFETEVSQSNWNWHRVFPNVSAKAHYSRLRVVFKDMQFITSVRNELYGTTDFLASCGGLLGLFMGFSAISMFEILYFFTLRLFCNIHRYGRRYWSGAEELMEVKVNN